jgi:hypothetical protein
MIAFIPREKGVAYAAKWIMQDTPKDEYVIIISVSSKLFKAINYAYKSLGLR